jgi:hypothetical protein
MVIKDFFVSATNVRWPVFEQGKTHGDEFQGDKKGARTAHL